MRTIASISCLLAPQRRFILSLDSMAPLAVHMDVAVSDRWIFLLCLRPRRSRSIKSNVLPESKSQGPPTGTAMAGPAMAPDAASAFAFALALFLALPAGLLFSLTGSAPLEDGAFAPLPSSAETAAGRQCGKGHCLPFEHPALVFTNLQGRLCTLLHEFPALHFPFR